MFKKATTPPVEVPQARTCRAGRQGDGHAPHRRDVLEHFQEGGAGWQDRMNAALRAAAGK